MDTGAGSVRFLAVALGCASLLLASVPPARADTGITVTASGPAKVVTDTDSSTGRIVATFTVTDPTLTATGARICRSYGDTKRQGCRYQRFDGQTVTDEFDEYGDEYYYDEDEYTRWDVVGQPGSWTVSYPIGFDEITREQCLDAAWEDAPFAADMQVMNDAGVVLATGAWTYAVVCTGIEGAVAGPDRTRVYAGRSTTSKPFTFWALDTRRELASYRICRYFSGTGTYSGCDRERLTARNRTDDGTWVVSYRLTWRPLGSAACAYVGRKWPQAGVRVQFYDRDLKQRLSLFRGTRVDC